MTQSTELIILNLTKVKDNSIVIHSLSREFGRKSFIVSIKKGASMAMFLPLSILEADVTDNPKSQLWRARNFISKYPLMQIRNNMHKNAMTLFFSEVLFKVLREGGYDTALFDWCEDIILRLERLEGGYAAFNTGFLVELAVELGFAPSGEDILPFADKGDKDNLDTMLRYLSHHLGTSLNIQSLKVLRELYNR